MSIPRKCKIEGCNRIGYFNKTYNNYYLRNGMCGMHNARVSRHGDVGTVEPSLYGQTKHPLYYSVYRNMIQRCYYKNHTGYINYGGRGITVCESWRGRQGFKNFLADMGEKPNNEATLDRIDNEKGYEPSNCRWASRVEQSRNQRMRVDTVLYPGIRHKYKRYYTSISNKGALIYIGAYDTLEEAISAKLTAEYSI